MVHQPLQGPAFPEGKHSHGGPMGKLKSGIAALSGVLEVAGGPGGYPRQASGVGARVLSLRPEQVRVVFGPPLDRAKLDELSKRGREAELIAYVREAVMACQKDADGWIGGYEALDGQLKKFGWRATDG